MGHSVTFQLKDIDISLDFKANGNDFQLKHVDFKHKGDRFSDIIEISQLFMGPEA